MTPVKLTILGVGLIGGSLGLCLKDKMGAGIKIIGTCRTRESMARAVELGAIDEACAAPEEAVEGADIVFLSPPVLQIVPLVKKILPHLKRGTVLTDAGSTKGYIWRELKQILPSDIYYIAGHPMTGREKSGVQAAQKDLFRHKAYVIVTDTHAPQSAKDKLMSVLSHTEANFYHLSFSSHDRCASVISHVPHVAAAALVTLLNRAGDDLPSCLKLIGGGFRDTTRIASSNADMWSDICLTNAEAIAGDLRQLQNILGEVINHIEAKDRDALHAYFTAAKERRDSILNGAMRMFDPN